MSDPKVSKAFPALRVLRVTLDRPDRMERWELRVRREMWVRLVLKGHKGILGLLAPRGRKAK